MEKIDFLIVGIGLSGISFCEQLEAGQHSFLVYEKGTDASASTVAGGLYNPIVLKKFTPIWNASEQSKTAMGFYNQLEQKLETQFDFKLPVLRKLANTQEAELWKDVSQKEVLKEFLDAEVISNENQHINAEFGFGKVKQTGRIDTARLVQVYTDCLKTKQRLVHEKFEYADIEYTSDGVIYQNKTYRYVVFCEGCGLLQNPFFNYLPLVENKGELLQIFAPELQLDKILKGPVFIIPIGKNRYLAGTTYEHQFTNRLPTTEAKDFIISKLKTMVDCEFTIEDHFLGFRPTVLDRRPLLGKHPIQNRLALLNGMGTRGVLLAPSMAKNLYDYLLFDKPLDKEIDIKRYENRLKHD
ncbi:MAG: FAD-dependent oxidoreductase [Flavobacteriaceae bacterium]|nr:FAD-dependent oxidoreductase [Flavobacteriaceae bacterium]MDZ4147472.1 FAD-dependent oxidoreductase [Flavobacteriaceae bacterium]